MNCHLFLYIHESLDHFYLSKGLFGFAYQRYPFYLICLLTSAHLAIIPMLPIIYIRFWRPKKITLSLELPNQLA